MDKSTSHKIIKDTLEGVFDKNKFLLFAKNLCNQIDESKAFQLSGAYIPDAFRGYIKSYERLGTFTDPEDKKIDVLIVYLQKETSLERARTAQRNFVARYLKDRDQKDAGLVAFVSPNSEDWRFSLIKMEYKFIEGKSGKVKVKEEFTPARRWSFLVGANENSHTAKSRLAPIVQDDEHNPTLKFFEEAFNIEKVTKEFFEKYRELFLRTKETLDEVVKKDSAIRKDFTAKGVDTVDFAKKLLGQIVFLYFLQKKGWFGVERDADWGSGPKNFLRQLFDKKHSDYRNFFNDILEPLFYEALARERDHDFYSRFNCKIPFLNGGLFDPINNYDWVHTDILLPDDLFSNERKTKEGDIGDGILDIFDRYNFTVKEDEPLEKEVAVDPEMLGKVFENLLEVKDRKSKGTYYTPREIVHYMCVQSLVNYLASELESRVSKEDLEKLIKYGETVGENEARVEEKGEETQTYYYKLSESIRTHAKLIDEKLANIKVCDPAIGSGAFPVGMMTEIVRARNTLSSYIKDPNRTLYNFKRDCIQNSLYGVDIDTSAVEIAKLRLWLSLVVDEDDIKQIKPLPNLDYKIVCGNSLLEITKDLFNLIQFDELENLKLLLFNETNPKIKFEYKKKIEKIINQITDGRNDFDFEIYFSEIFHLKKGFDIVVANPPYVGEKGNEEIFHEIKKCGLGQRFYSRWMDYFYYFFHRAINIAKPNGSIAFITTNYYLTATGANKLRADFKARVVIHNLINFNELKIFESAQGQHNIITILQTKKDANLVSRNCITNRNGFATQEILNKVLEGSDEETEYCRVEQTDLYEGNDFQIRPAGSGRNANSTSHKVLYKLMAGNYRLGDICNIIMGLVSRADRVSGGHLEIDPSLKASKGDGIFVLTKEELKHLNLSKEDTKKYVRPFFKNSDIDKYFYKQKNDLWLLYMKDEGDPIKLSAALKGHFGRFELLLTKLKKNFLKNEIASVFVKRWLKNGNYFVLFNPKEEYYFTQPKIIAPYRSQINTFAYNEIPWFASQDVCYIWGKTDEIDLRYILSFLNSKLCYYWLFYKGKRKGKIIEFYQKPLSEIPIKKIPESQQKPFVELVDRILVIAKDKDYLENSVKQKQVKEYERQIDRMIYKLYELTPAEIEIVEGS